MKFLFELYDMGKRGRIFLGYKTVHAESSEDAEAMLREKVDESITLCPLYCEQQE